LIHSTIEKLNNAGLTARYTGTTRGGEYHSPCPFCAKSDGDGGKDRLVVWPHEGRAWCRRCERNYDLAEVLALQTGISLADARKDLGVTLNDTRTDLAPASMVQDRGTWQARAERLVATGEENLWEPKGTASLAYLRDRGLTDDTIREARLGVHLEDRYEKREDWGLRPENNPETGRPRKVYLPGPAVCIPYFGADDTCRKVQFRCEDSDGARYRIVPGSRAMGMVLLPVGDIIGVVLLESALDALLCSQEVPEGWVFAALGSACARPDSVLDAVLRNVRSLLVATDADEAGVAAFAKLLRQYPHAVRLPLPLGMGKDVGEAFKNGLDLRAWCEIGQDRARELGAVNRMRAKPQKVTLTKAITVVEAGPELDIHYGVVDTPMAVSQAVEELCAAEFLGIDIETAALPKYSAREGAALDPWCAKPRLLQATAGGKVWVFDLAKIPLPDLAPILERPWYAHNALFEVRHLLAADVRPGDARCTMLQDNTLTNQCRSLRDLYAAHFGLVLDKALQDSDWSVDLSDAQLRYAARDALAAHHLAHKQRILLKRHRVGKLARLLYDAQHPVACMALNGLGFDRKGHKRLMGHWAEQHERTLAALRRLAGADINVNSPRQLAEFFERHATKEQLMSWPRNKSGNLTTAQDDLAAFADNPAVAALLDFRTWDGLVNRYGDSLAAHLHPETGRLHPDFRIAAARTGRMAARNPNVHGLPHDVGFRGLFTAESGQVLVRADFNQAQLRIAALLSGDARLLHAYEKGLDVHRMTAASVLGKAVEHVTPEERSLAKAIAFGLLFGMGGRQLAIYARSSYGVGITVSEADRVRRRFFETYPDLARWQRDQVAEARATGSCVTPMGRVRNFVHEDNDNFYTAAMNTPIQGAEAEVLYAALALLPDALESHGAYLLNAVHDEILVECPEGNVDAVEHVLLTSMKEGMRRVFPSATLTGLVEVGHGPTWGDAK
jgi:DNA polymerase-1